MTSSTANQFFLSMLVCAAVGIAVVVADNHFASTRASDLCDALPPGTTEEKIREVVSQLSLRPGVVLPFWLNNTYDVKSSRAPAADRPAQSNLVVSFRGFLSARKRCSIVIRDGTVINTFRE